MESWEQYNSNETADYVMFLLWLENRLNLEGRTKCEKCENHWGMGNTYPAGQKKYFGFKKKGIEAFF